MLKHITHLEKSSLLTIIVLIAILCIAGRYTYLALVNPGDSADSDVAVTLGEKSGKVFTDLEGTAVKIETYEGKVRIVNSWASWSPLSENELVELDTLAAEYADKNVVVLAVNRMEEKERAKAYLKKLGQPQNLVIILDPEDAFYKTVEGFAVPETIFYSSDGHVVFHKRGVMTLEEMRLHTDEAISFEK